MIVKNDPEQFQNYLSDASNYKGYADLIYIPENESDVAGLLKKFNSQKTKVTISGNGTGLTGGRVPEGGVVISLEMLDQIIELNIKKKFVRVQPAVLLKNLQDFVEANDLFYPPDPTERNCFIGSTVATNASGARTFKYGSTRNYILGLRFLLPDGEIVSIERGNNFATGLDAKLFTESGKEILFTLPDYKMPQTKNAAGYFCKEKMDLIDLFIGSEGTLGVITEIKLKLIDLPKNVLSCIAFFECEDCALNFIDEARIIARQKPVNRLQLAGNIHPRSLEFFDSNALKFLQEDYSNIPYNSQAAVWFEQDFDKSEEEILNCWIKLLKQNSCDEETVWLALDKKEEEKFHEFRHAISWKVNELMAQRNLKKVGTDAAVPVKHFRSFYQWMKKKVELSNLDYLIYGHFGDCHPHLNMLPKDETEYRKAKKNYAEICAESVRLDGTISAEHGIGKLKRDYLLNMYSEKNVRKMAALKLAFDPNKILNIGNIFDGKFLENI